MSLNRELNDRLFQQIEEQQAHVEYRHEFEFYNNVTEGNTEAVRQIMIDPRDIHMYDKAEYGQLSKNSLQNIRYHFVVSVALITRLCVEKGLERELAYTLSDLYISKMDRLTTAQHILSLHNEMLLDFTGKMADLPKQKIYSMPVIQAIEYIDKNRNKRITVHKIATALAINRSYLSSLFHQETGTCLNHFIRAEKIKAAANMLRFSDYSYAAISEYFGFSSQSHFIQCFRKEMGITPREYRRQCAAVPGIM
jgi:AraC family transcriptional regulator